MDVRKPAVSSLKLPEDGEHHGPLPGHVGFEHRAGSALRLWPWALLQQ